VHAQRTQRATDTLTKLAFGCGGELGARLSVDLGMGVSPDTLIRLIRNRPESEQPKVRVVAVDDWAKRKGQSYGTIVVDLERHQPIDLLPDREAETLAAWLKDQPQVEVLSRDRAKAYAQAASEGAPQSQQVADRWHLLKNLRDNMRDFFDYHRRYLTWRTPLPVLIPDVQTEGWDILSDHTAERKRLQNRSKRLARYQQVVTLHKQGLAIHEIARQVGIGHATVERYLAHGTFPERKRRQPQATLIDPYADYITRRWEEGCHNASQLWRELRAQGFSGSQACVHQHVNRLRRGLSLIRQPTRASPAYETHRYTASQASWLFCCDPDRLSGAQIQTLATLIRTCPDGPLVYELAQAWRELIQNRAKDALEPWLVQAEQSNIAELRRFVSGIRGDLSAVQTALTVEWSNGQAEGQITRLKLIKRQMYGRANFDLLRKRVLYSV